MSRYFADVETDDGCCELDVRVFEGECPCLSVNTCDMYLDLEVIDWKFHVKNCGWLDKVTDRLRKFVMEIAGQFREISMCDVMNIPALSQETSLIDIDENSIRYTYLRGNPVMARDRICIFFKFSRSVENPMLYLSFFNAICKYAKENRIVDQSVNFFLRNNTFAETNHNRIYLFDDFLSRASSSNRFNYVYDFSLLFFKNAEKAYNYARKKITDFTDKEFEQHVWFYYNINSAKFRYVWKADENLIKTLERKISVYNFDFKKENSVLMELCEHKSVLMRPSYQMQTWTKTSTNFEKHIFNTKKNKSDAGFRFKTTGMFIVEADERIYVVFVFRRYVDVYEGLMFEGISPSARYIMMEEEHDVSDFGYCFQTTEETMKEDIRSFFGNDEIAEEICVSSLIKNRKIRIRL